MALVTNITKKVDIPHEEGEWMEFRKLSWKQLEHASDVSTDALMERMKKMGGDILKALTNSTKEQEQDPASKYDRATVLRKGIARWSYEEKVNPDNLDSLDEETAAWAFKEILSLNNPRSEEETKNA